MRKALIIVLAFLVSGCATTSSFHMVKDIDILYAQNPEEDRVTLVDAQKKTVGWISRSIAATLSDIRDEIYPDQSLYFATLQDINAYSFKDEYGGKYIVITFGMLNFLSKDEVDEWAFLIAHETAHNLKGHSLKMKEKESTVNLLGFLVGVGLGLAGAPSYAGDIVDLGAGLIETKFSRDQEREADALALQLMLDAGYNPEGAISFMQGMAKVKGDTDLPFLSTHPSGEERIKNLQKLIGEEGIR